MLGSHFSESVPSGRLGAPLLHLRPLAVVWGSVRSEKIPPKISQMEAGQAFVLYWRTKHGLREVERPS